MAGSRAGRPERVLSRAAFFVLSIASALVVTSCGGGSSATVGDAITDAAVQMDVGLSVGDAGRADTGAVARDVLVVDTTVTDIPAENDGAGHDAGGRDGGQPDLSSPDVSETSDTTASDTARVMCRVGTVMVDCDDGDPCTEEICNAIEGVCLHIAATGGACEGPDGCGLGRCHEGRCVDYALCDDGYVCTEDRCEAGGVCDSENDTALGRVAPVFQLVDGNAHSASYGETIALSDYLGRVVVLIFHGTACVPCLEQGEHARIVVAAYQDNADVAFLSIDIRSQLDNIEAFVTYDSDGEPPLISDWPYLKDTDEARVWDHYCADNHMVVVVDRDGSVAYHRAVNFVDPPFRDELMSAIDRALGPAE